MEFTRINNDVNGNPRYVVHFLALLTEEESSNYDISVSDKYRIACKRANKLDGRKYNNKSYGGGIVFSTYNLNGLIDHIRDITGKRGPIGCCIAQRLTSALVGNGIDYDKLSTIIYGEFRAIASEQKVGDWLEFPDGTCYTRS